MEIKKNSETYNSLCHFLDHVEDVKLSDAGDIILPVYPGPNKIDDGFLRQWISDVLASESEPEEEILDEEWLPSKKVKTD